MPTQFIHGINYKTYGRRKWDEHLWQARLYCPTSMLRMVGFTGFVRFDQILFPCDTWQYMAQGQCYMYHHVSPCIVSRITIFSPHNGPRFMIRLLHKKGIPLILPYKIFSAAMPHAMLCHAAMHFHSEIWVHKCLKPTGQCIAIFFTRNAVRRRISMQLSCIQPITLNFQIYPISHFRKVGAGVHLCDVWNTVA